MKNKIKSSALLVSLLIISLFIAGGNATPASAKQTKKHKKYRHSWSATKGHKKTKVEGKKVIKIPEVKPNPVTATSTATPTTTTPAVSTPTSSALEIIKQFETTTPVTVVKASTPETKVNLESSDLFPPLPDVSNFLSKPVASSVAPAIVTVAAPTTPVTPTQTPTPIAPPTTAAPTLKNIQAMWVWGESYGIATDAKKQADFFTFVKAPHGNSATAINRIYLNGDSFDYNSTSNKTALRAFLKKAHQNGVAVEYLTGDSKWAIPGNESSALARADKMIAFNKETSDTQERYDGLHLDIEPYLLPDWSSNSSAGTDKYNDAIQTNYLNILATAKSKLKNSDSRLTLSADIPTWFSKVTDIWPTITSDSSPLDYITFMNYFDKESTFLYGYDGANKVGGIGPNLTNGGKIPMVFGAETIHLDPTSITFYEEGFNSLANVFSKAKEVYGTNSHFAGTAIHHYRTLVELKD